MPRLVGSVTPRLFTPPLRKLTPRTSSGFDVIRWAGKTLGWKPLPWQRWWLIAAGERLPDGSPRFRTVLTLVARQNGKTSLVNEALAPYWLAHGVPLTLATSSSLDTCREGWETCVDLAEDMPEVFGKVKVRRSSGDWQLATEAGTRYKVASAGRRGGRGLTVHRLIEDEAREQRDWLAHAAADAATIAVPDAQTFMFSNAGDSGSVVLNHFLALGRSGEDPRLGLFEWSASPDADIDDREAWAQANPALGHTITEAALESKLSMPASVFRTEHLCVTVPALGEAVPPAAWSACYDAGTLDRARNRVALCLDISPDLAHATLCAAAQMTDGRVRVETVAAWSSTSEVRQELPALLERIRPRAFGWFPTGPAAALAADLSQVKRSHRFSQQDTQAACQGLADLAAAGRVAHNGDELLAAHVVGAKRLQTGDGWRFSRRDGGHCDGAYAAAGAVHLARTLPAPQPLRIVTAANR